MDKELKKAVEHLSKSALSIIEEQLPILIDKRFLRFEKTQESIQDDMGAFRKEIGEFAKQLDDFAILLNSVDERTKQIKKTGDKAKETIETTIQSNLEEVPKQIENTIDKAIDKKPKVYVTKKPGFIKRLLKRG